MLRAYQAELGSRPMKAIGKSYKASFNPCSISYRQISGTFNTQYQFTLLNALLPDAILVWLVLAAVHANVRRHSYQEIRYGGTRRIIIG
jgi:hypothetical protein